MALGYSIYEKLAQIINAKFPAQKQTTAHLPYVGLITGAFVVDTQVAIICAIALLILIPLHKYFLPREESLCMPSFMEDMQSGVKDFCYLPLEEPTKRIAVFINNPEKKNVMITGPAGSGKSALIEGIVQRICKKDATLSNGFLDKKFYKVSCVNLIANTTYRGDLEARIKETLKFAKSQKNSIIVFDEIHLLTLANKGSEGGINVLEFFKENLARDGISVIGLTTDEEYHKFLRNDRAIARRFNSVKLSSPSFEDSRKMLQERAKGLLSTHPNITITDNTIYEEILHLVEQQLDQESSLVDKGFDILQTVFTGIRLSTDPQTKTVISKEKIKDFCREYFNIEQRSLRDDEILE